MTTNDAGVDRLILEMRRASTLVDEADGPAEYQHRLIALALIARQFLRKEAALRVSQGSAPSTGEKEK